MQSKTNFVLRPANNYRKKLITIILM